MNESGFVDQEELELELTARNMLEKSGPKCVRVGFGGDFQPTREQAIEIAQKSIKVQSQYVFHDIDQSGVRRTLFCSEVKMDKQRAQEILNSLDTEDIYTDQEVETIVVYHSPFDIRI